MHVFYLHLCLGYFAAPRKALLFCQYGTIEALRAPKNGGENPPFSFHRGINYTRYPSLRIWFFDVCLLGVATSSFSFAIKCSIKCRDSCLELAEIRRHPAPLIRLTFESLVASVSSRGES